MTSAITLSPRTHTEPPPPTVQACGTQAERRATMLIATPRVIVLFVVVLGALFLFFNLRRLWHTDLWGQLANGRTIVLSGSLPATDTLLPLAVGVPTIDTAWLTEVFGYWAIKRWGFVAMHFLGSLAVTLMSACVVYRAYQRSRSLDLSLSGLVLFVWGCWYPLGIIRSQLAGMLCFVLLLTMMTSRRHRGWQWVAIPALFALWSNLDGSFPAGLALLVGWSVGRVIDVAIRCGSLRAVWRDTQVRRWVFMTELAAVATLLNPYGLRIYAEAFRFVNPANVAGLTEWEPLSLRNMSGQVAAMIAVQLMVLYRLSPRRVAVAEVLLLFGFGAAALWSSRLLVWWVPIAAYCFVLHASAVMNAWMLARHKTRRPSPRSRLWSAAVIVLVGGFVTVTPFGQRLLFGKSRSPKLAGMVSAQTPLEIANHLRKLAAENRLPPGVAFHPHEWGDFLLWAGPQPMNVFATSQPFSLPSEVWTDYLSIINGSFDSEMLLDRYGVNLIILDDERHHLLIQHLSQNQSWQRTYADPVGSVFVRRQPI